MSKYISEIPQSVGYKARQQRVTYEALSNCFNSVTRELLERVHAIEEHEFTMEELKAFSGAHSFDIVGRARTSASIYQPVEEMLFAYLCLLFAIRNRGYRMDSFIRKKKGQSEIRERGSRVFGENGARAFLQDLRNKYLHGNPVFPGFTLSYSRDDEGKSHQNHRFSYSRDELLKITGWTTLSRAFISSWPKEKKLSEIIEQYSKLAVTHNQWVLDYLDHVFSKDFEETDRLAQEWGNFIRGR